MATSNTSTFGTVPGVEWFQVSPPSVLLKSPPPNVPAKMTEGLLGWAVRSTIDPPYGPFVLHTRAPETAGTGGSTEDSPRTITKAPRSLHAAGFLVGPRSFR